MLNPVTAKLIEEVFEFFDTHGFTRVSKKADLAKNDPEACIVSLLQSIKETLPEISATLYFTVERGAYTESVKEARGFLGPLAETPLGKTPRKKICRGYTKGELVNR